MPEPLGADNTIVPILRLDADGAERSREQLIDLLVDSVEHGASVNFVQPMTRDKAERWWEGALASHARGERVLFVATADDGRVAGSVQLILAGQENQSFRADIGKLLVHSGARRQGIGAALMRAAEAEARRLGRTLLTLDTETDSDGERLYLKLGWTRFGIVPGYATTADGTHRADCSFFYKQV
jgi:GNAT superfamily N-acetyltransferase